jgi:alpha-glucosidase
MARIMAAMILTLRGTPILYYGEELGLLNNDPKRVEDVQDIIGKKGWPKEKGRDGERTPMQWDASVNAGFNTGAKPWLPVDLDYQSRNVQVQRADPNSVLNYYRTLIAERRTNPALAGDMTMVDRSNPNVLSYVRSGGGKKVLTVLNFSAQPSDLSLAQLGGGNVDRVIVQNRTTASAGGLHLEPLGVIVAELN